MRTKYALTVLLRKKKKSALHGKEKVNLDNSGGCKTCSVVSTI
jgi:hypothetical protein